MQENLSNSPDITLATAPEIASLLGISRQFVYLMAERGELPHFRIGRAVRFDRREVLASLSRFRSEPMAMAPGARS